MGLLLFGKEVVTFYDVHAFVFPFTSSRFFTPLLVSPLPPPFPLLSVLSSVIFKKIPTFFPSSSLASILATSIQFAWLMTALFTDYCTVMFWNFLGSTLTFIGPLPTVVQDSSDCGTTGRGLSRPPIAEKNKIIIVI